VNETMTNEEQVRFMYALDQLKKAEDALLDFTNPRFEDTYAEHNAIYNAVEEAHMMLEELYQQLQNR
jgi:hypothetical protein